MNDHVEAPDSQVRGRVYIGGAWYEKDEQLIGISPATQEPIGSVHQLIGVERGGAKGELWWIPYGGDSVELYTRYRRFSGEALGGRLLHAIPLLRSFFRVRGGR